MGLGGDEEKIFAEDEKTQEQKSPLIQMSRPSLTASLFDTFHRGGGGVQHEEGKRCFCSWNT